MLRFATVHSRCSPGGATVCPDTPRLCPGHRRQSPGVTTASDWSRTAKPRYYTVAYEYQWNSHGTYKRYVICKVQKSSYILRQKRTAIRVVEKIGNGVINKTLTFYTRLSLLKKLLRIIQTRGPRGPWNAHLRQKIFKFSFFHCFKYNRQHLGGLNLNAIVQKCKSNICKRIF